MGGCPKDFGLIPFVPLRALIVDVQITIPIPPNVGIDIEFDQPMNQTVLPGNTTFEMTIDGTPLAIVVNGWSDATHLGCTYVGAMPAVDAFVRQLVLDFNCQSLLGTYSRPQSNVQWFP